MDTTGNFFESHAKVTICIIVILLLAVLYAIVSLKMINNVNTELQNKNIKTLVYQYYIGKIIDNNVGRFIKLREYPPNKTMYDRPSKNYMKNIAPHSIERKYYPITTDQDGFITGGTRHDDPQLKIVFLGGSTTECLYMEPSQRFPVIVGHQLEKKLHKRVNTYNGGVSANDSLHSLNILLNKVLPMKPDWVVLMHNINDLIVLRSQGTYWTKQAVKSPIQTSKNIFTRYEFGPVNLPFDEKEIMQAFKQNLETFISICHIHHIKPALMTQANRVQQDPLYHQFNQIIKEVAQQHNVLLIDLANKIPATVENLYDQYHYTAKGSELAAQIISEIFYEELT